MNEKVFVSSQDGIMTVTINRPEARNAVDREVAEGIAAAMVELDNNTMIRVAVLTGAMGMFCSGMDLKAYLNGESPFVENRGFA